MFGSTVFIWRHGAFFVTATCLLLVSAMTVANDNMNLRTMQSSSLRGEEAFFASEKSSARAYAAPRREAKIMSAKIAQSKMENSSKQTVLEEVSKSAIGGESSDGKTTMGAMVLDALQSQKQTNDATTAGRMLIKEGDVTGKVPGSVLESTAEQIASLVDDPLYGEGGYVEQQSSAEKEYYTYTRDATKRRVQRIVKLNLRVPSDHFQLVIQRVKQLIEEASPNENESSDHNGRITSLSTNSHDVTDEFVGTIAGSDTLDASRKAIQVLLMRANEIEDVMKIHAELKQLTQQSESLRRRALDLKNRSDLSVLNVRLEEWREEVGMSDDEDGERDEKSWSPFNSADLAWTHVSLVLMFAFDTLVYSMVWRAGLHLILPIWRWHMSHWF